MLEVNGGHGGDTFSSALNEHLDVPIATKEGPTPLRVLAARAMQHKYMKYMYEEQPERLACFPYNQRKRLEDLGANINPALHGIYIMRGAAAVTAYGRLNGEKLDADPHEIAVGLLATQLHDAGEAMHPEIKRELGYVLGDIPHGQKKDVHREKEEAIFFFTVPRMLPSLPHSTIQSMWDLVSHKDEDRPMWQTYKAAHDLGELEPGISAAHILMKAQDEGKINPYMPHHKMQRFSRYARLANEVIDSHLEKCQKWADKFSLVNDVVENEYGAMIEWYNTHKKPSEFRDDENKDKWIIFQVNDEGLVDVPEGYEKVLEQKTINLPRTIGDLAIFGYNDARRVKVA